MEESLLKQYMAERCFVKPEIRMSNYALDWNESSYGIPQSEVSELKAFLRDILPYISGAFFNAAGQISATVEEEVGDTKKARKIQDSLTPELQICYRKADHAYTLQMRQDGTTIIRRNEAVTTFRDRNKSTKSASLYLNFILGDLVFIR